MGNTLIEIVTGFIIGTVFVYTITRLVTSAYFRSKREHLRNYLKEISND